MLRNMFSFADVSYLTGPILEKELLVLSRRRRYYVLRFLYIIVLTLFAGAVFSSVASSSSSIYTVSRMSEAGRTITVFMVFFQFVISQGLSVIFLSTAISEEMHKRTLGILMTTPISSLQIVLGKLFSRFILLFLLLAMGLPLLAVIRVFGGVPWDFLISSFFIIFTSALFAASVSLFFSIFTRQALQAISRTFLFFILIYYVPLIVQPLAYFAWGINIPLDFLVFANPFYVLGVNIIGMTNPRFSFSLSWTLCCLVMTAGAVLFLTLSTIFVRRAALAQITGQAVFGSLRKERLTTGQRAAQGGSIAQGRVIPVKGPPIIWKDVRLYFTSVKKLKSKMAIVLFAGILLIAYGYCFWEGVFEESGTHIAFVCIYLFVGLFQTASIASSSITGERETKTWELLMTTPLTDKQIVLGKITGSIIRSWPFLFLALAHIIVFILLQRIHYAAFLPLVIVFICSFYLASAAGVMVSSLCRRSLWSSGITMFLFLSSMIPCCTPIGFLGSPLVIAGGILFYTAGKEAAAKSLMELVYNDYFLGFGQDSRFLVAFLYLAGILAIYFLAGFISYIISKHNVRFKIY